jgi:hypothetical protein
MSTKRFEFTSRISAPAADVFNWHVKPGAFERLQPPWEHVKVLERAGGIEDGGRVTLQVALGPIRQRWVSQHSSFESGRQFRDTQVAGPFARWEHTHRVEPNGSAESRLVDEIEYELPFGGLADLLADAAVRSKLARMFHYRHRVTADDVALHQEYREVSRMRILMTGSSGLVGGSLVPFLTTGGHGVVRLVRGAAAGSGECVPWNPAAGQIDAAGLEGCDAVVHLAGESIAARRWSAKQKDLIRTSRVTGSRLLCESLARLARPPRVLVSASAIGFYGDRGDSTMTESSAAGSGFLPNVCREWEAATEPAVAAGIRVVHLRTGIVLSPAGGALAKMLTPFRMGVAGQMGSGRQYMSWIALDDVIGAIHHAIMNPELHGAVNATAPNPVTNYEFTKTLGRVLRRPTILPMPAFAARLAFGEMADALLLASTRVEPARLLGTGYQFRFPKLEGALRHLLGRVDA